MITGNEKDTSESYERNGQNQKHPNVPRFKAPDGFGEPDKRERCRYDNHRIHTGALPITTAQVQPHAEFIEGESHGHAIEQGHNFRRPADWTPKDAVAAHGREQKNSLVQVVHVRFAHEEIKIVDELGHDQEHKYARQRECDDETK